MSIETFEGVVEKGQVRFPDGAVLPERTVVYVIVPGSGVPMERAYSGVRLADPADAQRFELKVEWSDESRNN